MEERQPIPAVSPCPQDEQGTGGNAAETKGRSVSDLTEESLQRIFEMMGRRRKDSLTKPHEWPPVESHAVTAEYKGHKYAILQSHSGLCGYVALPPGHRYHGVWYDDIPIEIHGGWTFCQLGTDGNFWIGFDTAHLNSGHWSSDAVATELTRAMDELFPDAAK